MEIKTNTLNELDIQTTGKVSNMKLDEDSHAMIFQMFTGGLYSDPIGTVIREITSNCFDSHIEADVDSTENPVVVELSKEMSGTFIIFKDKGVGMSPDRIENIYGTYFKSTKRSTNDQIGGFGLGGKTPLAYTDSFYIVTRFEGIEYTYNVFEGNNVPAIELMGQQSTKLPNGTDVKVPVKEMDVNEFEKKTLRQLYYFENIVFKGFSDYHVSNDYSIVKGKNFLYRGDNYSDKMHVCYGKVAYPIDYEAMGVSYSDYRIPVAVRIEIGELEGTGVTPSREAIKYSKANIKTIKAKMDEALQELKDLLGEQYNNVQSLEDYYKATENFGNLYFGEDHEALYLGNLIKQSDVTYPNFKYDGLTIPKQNEIIDMFYSHKLYGKKYSTRGWGKQSAWTRSLKTMGEYSNIFYTDGEFKRKVIKQSYFRTFASTENFYVLTPINLDDEDNMKVLKRKMGALQEIINDDSLSDKVEYKVVMPKKKAEKLIRTLYTELHAMIAKKSAGNYDEIEVPESFIEARKQEKLSAEMLKTTIPVRTHYYKGRARVTLEQLKNHSGRIYYGFNEDGSTLENATYTFRQLCDGSGRDIIASDYDMRRKDGKGTAFITISKGNEKYMRMLGKKAIHIDYFYQTFVARKLDKILDSKSIVKIKVNFSENVLDTFKKSTFKVVDEDVYNTAVKVRNELGKFDSEYGWHVNTSMIKHKLGVDIENLDANFKYQKELDQLVKLTAKNKNRLKWIEMPHEFDLERDDHRELVEMLELMFER